ncbi:MAG: hypothetical protein M3O02_03180 [Acidobacteriota bacterium]|nr:hypothetical protein [Acidobacteriota bacterium]
MKKLLYISDVRVDQELFALLRFEDTFEPVEAAWLDVGDVSGPCDDGQGGELGEGPDIAFIAQGGVLVFEQGGDHEADGEAADDASDDEDGLLGEGRAVRQVGFVHDAELLALLAFFEVGSGLCLADLLEQELVLFVGLLVVAGEFLVLFGDLGAGFDACAVGSDLGVELGSLSLLGGDGDVDAPEACAELLRGWGVEASGGGCGGGG